MSLDRSLKTAAGLSRHRNVLTRDERIAKLTESKKFDPAKNSPTGLPKVANRKVVAAAKPKKEAAAEGDAAAAAPAGKAVAPAGKAAAPAGKGKGK
jgi:small basic protein (TIGR04137 family)